MKTRHSLTSPREPGLLSPSQAAAMVGVSTRTLQRWEADETKNLKPLRTLGGHRRYRLADIEALLEVAS